MRGDNNQHYLDTRSGVTAAFACVCGMQGTHEAVLHHIDASSLCARGAISYAPLFSATWWMRVDSVPSVAEDFSGNETKAHYLPNAPKLPARATSSFSEPDPTPAPLSPTPMPPSGVPHKISCPLCPQGTPVQDLPEITSWSCGHEILKRPRSIAASFQDMLRSSYQAGVASAATGETFEAWYQREVLQ